MLSSTQEYSKASSSFESHVQPHEGLSAQSKGIMENIFSFIESNPQDLASIRSVNRRWNQISTRSLERRFPDFLKDFSKDYLDFVEYLKNSKWEDFNLIPADLSCNMELTLEELWMRQMHRLEFIHKRLIHETIDLSQKKTSFGSSVSKISLYQRFTKLSMQSLYKTLSFFFSCHARCSRSRNFQGGPQALKISSS